MNANAFPSEPRARRPLFPENEPIASGFIDTGEGHEVYFEECGAREGKPCVILHGGPGGAINPTMRRFFDPRRWRMTLFDQRGCGRSRPNASLDRNTTWTLIEDIERLRRQAGVEKWTVFGGSWGSTLALGVRCDPSRAGGGADLAAGVFLLTKKELNWFYQDGASMLFPDAWERVPGPDPRGRAGRPPHRLSSPPDPSGTAGAGGSGRCLEPVGGRHHLHPRTRGAAG